MRVLSKRSIAVVVGALSVFVGAGVFLAGPLYAQTNDLHPGDVLSGSELAVWDGLSEEYQEIFLDELLPSLKGETSERSKRVDAVGGMVIALADIQR